MPSGIPRQATPGEIARFGHIATFLREKMTERGCQSMGDFNESMGLKRDNSVTFKWVNSRGGPSPAYRAKLAKVFKVKADFFMPRETDGDTKSVSTGTAIVLSPAPKVQDVLQFNVGSTGEARIRLDVTLPVAQAVPLLRVLLDTTGLIVGGQPP